MYVRRKAPKVGKDTLPAIQKVLQEGRDFAADDPVAGNSLRRDVVIINAALLSYGECGCALACV